MDCRIYIILLFFFRFVNCFFVDVTSNVFGVNTTGVIAAFGDFNSDKLTDVFVLTDQGKRLQVYLANGEIPYLSPSSINCTLNGIITSVVPGDFNGDSRMDVLITLSKESKTEFKILWGSLTTLNCTVEDTANYLIIGQPLILDFDGDKLPDIIAEVESGQRQVWLSSSQGSFTVENISMGTEKKFKIPHSHSLIDLNNDFISDMVLSTVDGFEVWHREAGILSFKNNLTYQNPSGVYISGQSVFVDIDLDGTINHLLPVCFDRDCLNSAILIWHNQSWTNVGKIFEKDNSSWTFIFPTNNSAYEDVISLKIGDYDLDGYPDFLTVLKNKSNPDLRKAFLLQNVPCDSCPYGRGFSLSYIDGLSGISNVVLAAFYDLYNDGVLDILLVTQSSANIQSMMALQNNYDANSCFMKIIVLSGLCYTDCPSEKVPYGVNQPGPTICYEITRPDGKRIFSCAGQLSQSAHFALQLPYTVFGLGHTPNFVDRLKVGVSEKTDSRKLANEWTNLIPNSQMFVIPNLISDNNRWINKLFVTPSHQVLMTFAALSGVMALISIVILGLHLKEKREDKLEKLKESHKFHFDAM